MIYFSLETLHVLGVVILLGNVTATSVWKVFADRTGDPQIMAFAQRLVTITDWLLTVLGIVLIVVGGFGAAGVTGTNPFGARWLWQAELLFAVSGSIWLFILLPIQLRQARESRLFAVTGVIPESYRRDSRRWLQWGIIATVPLVAATWLMIAKPM